MKFDVIHLLPHRFPYGAYAMLEELHIAFETYFADSVNQEVIYLREMTSKEPAYFDLSAKNMNLADTLDHAKKNLTNPVILFHKIAATDCRPPSRMFRGKIPFAIINHTQVGKNNCFRNIARCDKLVCVSPYMERTAHRVLKGYDAITIRNGVNQFRYEDIEPMAPREGYFHTGRMNNFNRCKHPRDWIKFMHSISLNKPMWHDYLGEGNAFKQSQKEEKAQRRKNSNRVYLPGRIINFNEKISYVKKWDIFLYEIPGMEGTSMSLLESLACGTPAVINNKPGNRGVIENGVNGFVYNKRDEAVEFINDLIDNPRKLRRLRNSTKKHFAAHLDAKVMAQQYIDMMKDMYS